MNLTSVQRLRLVGNLVELEENCAENDIAIAEMLQNQEYGKTRVWANAQRDGRPAEYRWRPLFNAAKFG